MKQRSIRYLVLWLTTSCNLKCCYCYRVDEKPSIMPKDVIRSSLFLAATSGLPFHVQLAGGEPTLEPELIEFVGVLVRKHGLPATIALQTNGTLIDKALVELCRRYDISVGVSLDGPPSVQESLRGKSGATFRGLYTLQKMDVPVRITTVLSSINASRLVELVLSVLQFNNIQGVGLDPIVFKGEVQRRPSLLPSEDVVRLGIKELLKVWRQLEVTGGVYIKWRELDLVQRALSKDVPGSPYCHAYRGESLAIHPDGTAYPCAQNIGDPEMSVGVIDSIDWEKLETSYQAFQLRGECVTCPLEGRCPGDCPSRLRYNEKMGNQSMCVIYRTIAEELNGNSFCRRRK